MKHEFIPANIRKYHYWRGFRSAALLAIFAFGMYGLFAFVIYPPDYTMSPAQYQNYLTQNTMNNPVNPYKAGTPFKTDKINPVPPYKAGRTFEETVQTSPTDPVAFQKQNAICKTLQFADNRIAVGAHPDTILQCMQDEMASIRSKIADGKGTSIMQDALAKAVAAGY